MTRHDPASGGAETGSVGTHRQDTPEGYSLSPTRGAIVRLTGDVEALAVELLDRLGPAGVTVLAGALLALAAEVRR